MTQYREVTVLENNHYIVKTNDDGSESWIPVDEANSDYQAYLKRDEAEAK
jgi:hypothetical protein